MHNLLITDKLLIINNIPIQPLPDVGKKKRNMITAHSFKQTTLSLCIKANRNIIKKAYFQNINVQLIPYIEIRPSYINQQFITSVVITTVFFQNHLKFSNNILPLIAKLKIASEERNRYFHVTMPYYCRGYSPDFMCCHLSKMAHTCL